MLLLHFLLVYVLKFLLYHFVFLEQFGNSQELFMVKDGFYKKENTLLFAILFVIEVIRGIELVRNVSVCEGILDEFVCFFDLNI